MGMNIDVEEQDWLVLLLKVIEVVLLDLLLVGWDGFGVVVQVYGKCVGQIIDWLYQMVDWLDCCIMVWLVKGVYWDSEIKWVQVDGYLDFLLFISKIVIDVSYVVNVCKLIGYVDCIYL